MSRRAAIQDGYREREDDAPYELTRQFYAIDACPFAQAVQGTLPFKAWLAWSGMRELTQTRNDVRFPARRPSLLLWYASYAHGVSVVKRVREMDASSYHEAVTDTLEALKAKKDRAFKLHIVHSKEGDRKHQLFHRLFGKKQREPLPFEDRVYVPAQFFMHTWKSVSIDNSTFRLWSALPELYWIHVMQMGQRNPFVRLTLSNNVDVTNAYIMNVTTLEDVDVECMVDQNSEAARARTRADDYSRDLLGVSNGIRHGRNVLPKLERLRLKNAIHLTALPDISSVPLLDVLQLDGLAEANPRTLVSALNERTNKIRVGNASVSIGPPRHLSIINCAVEPDDEEAERLTSDIEHWITITPRTEVLELGGVVFAGVPSQSGGPASLKRLALFETDNLHFAGTLRACRPQELVLQDLEDGDAEAGDIENVLFFEKIKFTSAAFVNTGITDFSRLLRGQEQLETLTISDIHTDEGAQYSIPYEDLVSLREQRGFLASDDRLVKFTPETAAKFRAHTSTLEAKLLLEDARQLGMSTEADEINTELDRQALTRLPEPFRWREPDNPDNVMLPLWIDASYYTKLAPEQRQEVIHNWALWAAEMNDWVCGSDPLEGFHLGCNMIEDIRDVVRFHTRSGPKLIQFEWRLAKPASPSRAGRGKFMEEEAVKIEREALESFMKHGVVPLTLRLVRRPRQLSGANENVPGIDLSIHLDTESETGHMFLESENVTLSQDGNIMKVVLYVHDKVLKQRFILCSVQATRGEGATFDFPLESLMTLFGTCSAIDMMMACRARVKEEELAKPNKKTLTVPQVNFLRQFIDESWRKQFPGLVKVRLQREGGKTNLKTEDVRLLGDYSKGEDPKSSWEHTNRERAGIVMGAFLEMADVMMQTPLVENDVHSRLMVRLNPMRALMSDNLSLVCLLCMGMDGVLQKPNDDETSPLSTYIRSLLSQGGVALNSMMTWLTVGRPVHSDHVVFGVIGGGEEEESLSPQQPQQEVELFVPTSQISIGDRIASLADRWFVFHQAKDDEGDEHGLQWLFESEDYATLYDVLIGIHPQFVAWKDAGGDEGTYDDRYRLAQFEWDMDDVRAECTRLKLSSDPSGAMVIACNSIIEFANEIDTSLRQWKDPMVELVEEAMSEKGALKSDADPRWQQIGVAYKAKMSVTRANGISKHIYALLEKMQDGGDEVQRLLDARSLEEKATLASTRQPSPHRSVPPVESPVKNQRLVSPVMLSEPPPPPVTVFQSPEQAAQKPQKKKLKLVIDEEEEEEEDVRLYGEEVTSSKRKSGVQVIVTRPQELIVINLVTPESSPEKPARYSVVQKSGGGGGSERRTREFTPPRKQKGESVVAPTTPVVAKKKKVVIDLSESQMIGCDHCGSKGTTHMERCSRCKSAHYCNNSGRCRIAAWYNGHQNNCTPLV